ncbi:MAG: hypothetical protein BMS9Abin26_1394 [Gammaproteobacteria bacterium]|nr:MAG: hypothetical protein BMS9Abin26_1394 [Gammaproteobacteria bacterium]
MSRYLYIEKVMKIRIVAEEFLRGAVDQVRRLTEAAVPGMALSDDSRVSLIKREHNMFIDGRFSPIFSSIFRRLRSH